MPACMLLDMDQLAQKCPRIPKHMHSKSCTRQATSRILSNLALQYFGLSDNKLFGEKISSVHAHVPRCMGFVVIDSCPNALFLELLALIVDLLVRSCPHSKK